MTIGKIMFFKICVFCLHFVFCVAFSVGEYNTGFRRRQENEYDNYNVNENYQNGHRREFQINRDYENFNSNTNTNTNYNSNYMTRNESSRENTNRGNSERDPNSNSKKDSFLQDSCGLDVPRRIIGGSSTDIDEFPWLCLLQYVDPSGEISHDCSGVLISKRYVLTAAHCTNGLGITTKNLKLRRVRLGEWDLSTDRDCQGDVCGAPLQEIEVEDIIPHEKYKPSQKSQSNDIALVRLRKEAELNQFVQPICLPFDEIGNTDYEGKKLTVSGWGRTSNARDSSSNIKMKVDLPIVNRDRCRQFYQSFYGDLRISESQFCAGGESGKDSCQGDSGGPLMTTERTDNEIHWFVIGIVSSGPAACGVEDRPSLYTNVSQYMNWILDNVRN